MNNKCKCKGGGFGQSTVGERGSRVDSAEAVPGELMWSAEMS